MGCVCGVGGHAALGVSAAVLKCSAQGDLAYLFGPRQAGLPEGTGEGECSICLQQTTSCPFETGQ